MNHVSRLSYTTADAAYVCACVFVWRGVGTPEKVGLLGHAYVCVGVWFLYSELKAGGLVLYT